METSWHIKGARALKYPEFAYRRAVYLPIEAADYEERAAVAMTPDGEYPRYLIPPAQPACLAEDVLDVTVRLGPEGPDGLAEMSVWLQPNCYTYAKTEECIYSVKVAHGFTLRKVYTDEVLARAFPLNDKEQMK
jgi:hypothetical protein